MIDWLFTWLLPLTGFVYIVCGGVVCYLFVRIFMGGKVLSSGDTFIILLFAGILWPFTLLNFLFFLFIQAFSEFVCIARKAMLTLKVSLRS